MKLKKYKLEKKKTRKLEWSSKPKLIFKTYNPLNSRSGLNYETQFPINLMLNDKTGKKYQI
jgi:hypothetical protein